jgi:hypothetical protein
LDNLGVEVSGAGGQAPVVTVTIDGVKALEAIPIPPELGCKHGRVKDVQNGFFCTRATKDSELRVDNLAIWAE